MRLHRNRIATGPSSNDKPTYDQLCFPVAGKRFKDYGQHLFRMCHRVFRSRLALCADVSLAKR
jgi:hypothetical protein